MLQIMAPLERQASLGGDDRRKQRKILCVVQDTVLGRELVSIFQERSDRVHVVATETEGLDALLQNSWDAVLLEIRRPGRQGYAACARIRQYWRGPLVLVITSPAASADVVRGYEMGADAYVTTPFDPRELIVRMEALFSRPNGVSAAA